MYAYMCTQNSITESMCAFLLINYTDASQLA